MVKVGNWFDGADPTKVTMNTPKIKVDGKHLVQVINCRAFESENPETAGRPMFATTFKVVESTCEELVGREMSWVVDVSKRYGKDKVGANNVLNFIASSLGTLEVSGDNVDEACSEENPLRECMVCVQTAVQTPVRSEGAKPWTKHVWYPAEDWGK